MGNGGLDGRNFGSVTSRKDDLLEIVVPTVAGRERFLEQCLLTISHQVQNKRVLVRVSGNASSPKARELARAHGAHFDHYEPRLAPWEHVLQILSRVESPFVWLVGDDDMLHEEAVDCVLGEIGSDAASAPDAVIGRVRFFSQENVIDLGDPDPVGPNWQPGRYCDLAAVGQATLGALHYGAFVVRREVFLSTDFYEFSHTHHAIFASFWWGLARLQSPSVSVVSAPLAKVRKAQKTWHSDQIQVLLGLQQYNRAIPEEIGVHRLSSRHHLGIRKALRLSANCNPSDRSHLRELVHCYNTFDRGAKLASRLPRFVAKALVSFQNSLSKLLDPLYIRIRAGRLPNSSRNELQS